MKILDQLLGTNGRVFTRHLADEGVTGDKASTALKTKSLVRSVAGIAGGETIVLANISHACTVTRVAIISDTATTGSDGSNNYAFNVANITETEDLNAAAKDTTDEEVPEGTPYELTVDQNATLAALETIAIEVTKTGTPTDISSADITAIIEYTVAD